MHKQDTILEYLIKLKSNISSARKHISAKNKEKRDSLLIRIDNLKDDSLLVDAYSILGDFYFENLEDYENAWRMSDEIFTIAKNNNNNYYYSLAHWGFGVIWFAKGNYYEALKEFELGFNALTVSDINIDLKTRNQARLLGNMGTAFQLLNDWDNGLSYYLKSIDKLRLIGDSLNLSVQYYNIGYIYSDINEWDMCYRYSKEATKYLIKDHFHDVVVLSRAASVCIQLDKINEAQHFLQMAKEYGLSYQHNLADLNYYCALGQYAVKKKDYSNADKYLSQAYEKATLYGDPYWVAVQARELGLFYLAIKNYPLATRFFFIAKDVASAFDYQPQVLQSLGDLSELAKAQGLLVEAIDYKEQQVIYSDSLVKKQNHNRILYYNAKFEADKKQNEILQLQKDNEIKNLTIKQSRLWLFLTLLAIITLTIVGLLTYRNLKHKQNIARQKEELQHQQISALEKDKQLILADAILKGQEEERGRIAKDLHDGLGGLLSGVKISLSNMRENIDRSHDNVLAFDRSLDMLDNSIHELRRVSHNLMPESLVKFGLATALRDFCESINTMRALTITFQVVGEERRLDSSQEIIVYRIIQELVNNVLKHSGSKNAIVQLMYEMDRLSVTVEDDGKGFEKDLLTFTSGMGWPNIKSRIDYLKGKFDFITQPGEGTSVHIHLPV